MKEVIPMHSIRSPSEAKLQNDEIVYENEERIFTYE